MSGTANPRPDDPTHWPDKRLSSLPLNSPPFKDLRPRLELPHPSRKLATLPLPTCSPSRCFPRPLPRPRSISPRSADLKPEVGRRASLWEDRLTGEEVEGYVELAKRPQWRVGGIDGKESSEFRPVGIGGGELG